MNIQYMVKTKRGYEVTGPDSDGDIEIESDGRCIWLTADDLRMMLARFENASRVSESPLRGDHE